MRTVLIIIVLVLTMSAARAEMYQWVAEDGSVTFKDAPPPAAKKRARVKVYSDSDFDPSPPPQPVSVKLSDKKAPPPATPSAPQNERFTGTVEIYVTDWCGYCKKALNYMNSKGIAYVAYNIDKDKAANQRHRELGGRGVPLIIIGANKMSGFSAESLDFYLNHSK